MEPGQSKGSGGVTDLTGIPAAVWAFAGRSLDTILNIVAGVWASATRTLTAPTNLTNDDAVISNTNINNTAGTVATNLNTTVSSRATQAQIINDATPFAGANIGAIYNNTNTAPLGALTGSLAGNGDMDILVRGIADTLLLANSGDNINLNVNTEQLLSTLQTGTLAREYKSIRVYYSNWLTDVNIAASGATLTIRVYASGVLLPNLTQIITEAVTPAGAILLPDIFADVNHTITLQSSVAPAGAVNLITDTYNHYNVGA